MDAIGMASPTGLIQNVSSALSAAQTGSEVGTKMLSKALDTQDAMGASMIRMMENSVNPAVGGNFDMSV
ncbi:MAG: YjfB family protein [Lachnospiraceae bacterium]|nr:YjfB family protein [Lachnospiraceae bacterium]